MVTLKNSKYDNSYETSLSFFDVYKSTSQYLNPQTTKLARTTYGWAYDFYIDYYELSTSQKSYEISSFSFQDVSSELGG